MRDITLSVVIPSYNTSVMTRECIDTTVSHLAHYSFHSEIIVVDDASTDDSAQMLKQYAKESLPHNVSYRYIIQQNNAGFGATNNAGFAHIRGTYTLLLNSDAFLQKSIDFNELCTQFDDHTVGALTIEVRLLNGSLDWACHRSFPTIWNSFTYFSKLEKLSVLVPPLRPLFGGYHDLTKNLKKIHEIDTGMGAFYLIRTSILKTLGGFDPDFFMYGEDIDLSYRIKRLGYKILYIPGMIVLHKKRASGLMSKLGKTRSKTRYHFYDAMGIFYHKHEAARHNSLTNWIVSKVIGILRAYGP